MKETTTDGRTDRRTYLKLAGTGALAAGVAGCLGLGGNPSNQNGDGAAEDDSGGGASGNSGKDNGDTRPPADQPSDGSGPASYTNPLSLNERAVTFLRFKRPETYTFETVDSFGDAGRLVVDVVEATESGEITLKLHYEVERSTFDDTIQYDLSSTSYWAKILASDAGGSYLSSSSRLGLITYYTSTHAQITVGDVYIPKALSGTYKAEITGTDTIAGVKCYTFTVVFGRGEDKYVDKGCMALSLELLPHIVNKKGCELQQKMTLVEYEQK